MAAGVGSSIFFSFSLLVISLLVLLLLRYYLPIRSTPGYLLLPVFLSLALPSSIILLVPIDLASNAGTGTARGIWLPDRALLVAWRITYWLTFILTWYDIDTQLYTDWHADNQIIGSHYLYLENTPILDTEIPRTVSYTLCDQMLAINLPSSPLDLWAPYTSSSLKDSTS